MIYTPEALEACVRLTVRYVSDRHLPDKAIDLMESNNLVGGCGKIKTRSQFDAAMEQFGSLEEILAHADEQTPKRRQNLTEFAETALMCRDLSVIDVNVPVGIDPLDVPLITRDPARLSALRSAF